MTERYYTICDACNQVPFCGMTFEADGGTVTHVRNWPSFPRGPICSKAYGTLQRENHDRRLLYPLKRINDKKSGEPPAWRRIGWDEAYSEIAVRLKEARDRYGAESVLFYVGDPKEPRAAVQRLAYTFGSPNYGTESSTGCRRGNELAERLNFGTPVMDFTPSPGSKLAILWGYNPAASNPWALRSIFSARETGTKFIVVDPRRTQVAEKLADLHLRLRPATDGALALGIINLMFGEGLYDKEFASRWIHGLEGLRSYASRFSPEEVERITGIPPEKVEDAARMIGRAIPAVTVVVMQGLTHQRNGVQMSRAVYSILALAGGVDASGGNIIPTYPLFTPWDSGDPMFTRRNELYPKLRDRRVDAGYVPVWAKMMFEVATNYLPEYVREGKIRSLLGWGINAMIWPRTKEYVEALKQLELFVAVDNFYRPVTHEAADFVLSAATNMERIAPFPIFGRKVFGRKVLKPRGESKEDWQIAFELGVALGYGGEFWGGDVREGVNSILAKYGLTYEQLQAALPDSVEVPAPGPDVYKKYELGMLRDDGRPGFPTPTGKVEVHSTILEELGYDPLPVFKPPAEPTKDYPLILVSGPRVPFYTHSKWRETWWLRELMPEPVVDISPGDAGARGIGDGDRVVVRNQWGEVKVKAEVTEEVPRGVVSMIHGWMEANINDLVPRELDPLSNYPPYRELICEVERVV